MRVRLLQGIPLIGGQRYYIEALHKEGNGADHVAVGWRFQNGDFEGPIPGNRLIPYVDAQTTMAAFVDAEVSGDEEEPLRAYPNPVANNSAITISASGPGDGDVEFISAAGTSLQRERVTFDAGGEATIQLDRRIIPGMYFLKVFAENKQRVLKVKVD
jgi:hypothetical protein